MDYETLNSCTLCESKDIFWIDKQRNICQCKVCGLVFDNPRPSTAAIQEYYSKKGKYDDWLEVEDKFNRLWIRRLNDIRRLKPSGSLLDVGAGIGHFLSFAKKYYQCEGTEISREGIKIANDKFGIFMHHGELEDIDFKGKQFDLIVLSHILEHFPFPGRSLKVCRSLLKPGGIIYIAVPNESRYSFRILLPRLLGLIGLKKFRGFGPAGLPKIDLERMNEIHLSHFSEKCLIKFLTENGYKILKNSIEFSDPYMFKSGPVQIIRHLIYFFSAATKKLLGKNMYNCLWIAATVK